MSDKNYAIQTGNVVADAQVTPVSFTDKQGNKQNDYSANFTLAVNNSYVRNGKRYESTMYSACHRFLTTEGQKNYYTKNITKGKHLAVIGSIKNNNYTGKNGKQYSYQLIPNQIMFLGSKSDGKSNK